MFGRTFSLFFFSLSALNIRSGQPAATTAIQCFYKPTENIQIKIYDKYTETELCGTKSNWTFKRKN